jgi:hypothetical protein
MKKSLAILLLLAGCATPACKTVTIEETKTVYEPAPVERYIIVHDRPVHEELLKDYAKALAAEKLIVVKAKPPTNACLTKLGTAAQVALAPVEQPGHSLTPGEVAKAHIALDTLDAGVALQICPKK